MPPVRTRLALAALLLAALAGPAPAQPPKDAPRFALLVGCTRYPNADVNNLRGPVNDVRLWRETLTKNFGFNAEDITTLTGWDKDQPAANPTRQNITAALEALIAKARPGTHVVISLSGHGMQVPLPKGANPLDPDNFEPDGLDEVFLPADVGNADKDGQIPNALKDDEIGKYLDRLRAKGAHVLIIFDCCHSGTMTRSAPKDGPDGPRVVSRVAAPSALGISDPMLAASVERAKKAVAEEQKRTGKPVVPPAKVRAAADNKGGSLVAFYGAQPFEEAPEMPLPEDKPIKAEFFHGLLTFTLNTALQQRQAPLTYGDLAQIMASQYRGAVGVKGPVPYAEGDIDREVLGYNVWPRSADIVLTKGKAALTVNAGALRGLTPGSVLALHPPANDPRKPDLVLGHLRVVESTIANATVAPVAFDGKPAPDPKDVPDLARCSVAARDYGDMRVKVFVADHPALQKTFAGMAADADGKDVLAMIRQTPTAAEADWVLEVVSPRRAAGEFGLKEPGGDVVLLLRAAGREVPAADAAAARRLLEATGRAPERRVFGVYDANALPGDLAGFLARDLPKIFRWQNLWRVAATTSNARGSGYGVKLEVARQPSKNATGPGEVVRGAVPNGAFLDFRVKNEGKRNLWAVALYLDSDLGIDVWEVVPVEAGKTVELDRGEIKKESGDLGTQGMVLFLLPQDEFPTKPNFAFLEQTPLRVATKSARSADAAGAPKTPFGELLKGSVVGPGTRAPARTVSSTPGVVSGSWVVTP